MTRVFVIGALICTFSSAALGQEKMAEPLTAYVSKNDPSFTWEKRSGGSQLGAEYAELRLTSQTWRGTTWKHRLFVIKPSGMRSDIKHALLFISGGSWKSEYDDPTFKSPVPKEAALLGIVAQQLQTPVAILLDVPHQPLFDGKKEDQIIAYTFDEYMKTGESDWPLLLPMVKSAVRAMDAVQEHCRKEWSLGVETFTISGASKRGWTTWLTGAVDPRATAIAPIVIDMLNMEPQMSHQLATFGSFSEQIEDYTQRKLQQRLRTPEGKKLQAIVDPYQYRDRLTQPKLIILGTNDRYWPLDALNLYWDGLKGEKHILYVPNNGHGVNDFPRLIGSLAALHRQGAGGKALPNFDWKFEQQGQKMTLRVTPKDAAPERVALWTASAPTRDFRDARWSSTATRQDGKDYVGELSVPASGFAAMFAEAVFPSETGPVYLSTNVRVLEPVGAQ